MRFSDFLKEREREYGDIVWDSFFRDSNYALKHPNHLLKNSELIGLAELQWWAGEKIKETEWKIMENKKHQKNYPEDLQVVLDNYALEKQLELLREIKGEKK